MKTTPCKIGAMSTPSHSADLCARIERLVLEHIAASQKAATEALHRAFSSALPRAERRQRARPTAHYRSKDALVALQDAIYQRLRENPGMGATELSAQLKTDARALSAPLAKLKKIGLIRNVGQRNATRYFPVSEGTFSTA